MPNTSGVNQLYSVTTHLSKPEITRIILSFDKHKFSMTIGDCSVVAEFASDVLRAAANPEITGVLLDDEDCLDFGRYRSGLTVRGGTKVTETFVALMNLGKAGALNFISDINDASAEAQQWIDSNSK